MIKAEKYSFNFHTKRPSEIQKTVVLGGLSHSKLYFYHILHCFINKLSDSCSSAWDQNILSSEFEFFENEKFFEVDQEADHEDSMNFVHFYNIIQKDKSGINTS